MMVIHFDEKNAFFVGVRTIEDDAVGFVHRQDLNLVARKTEGHRVPLARQLFDAVL